MIAPSTGRKPSYKLFWQPSMGSETWKRYHCNVVYVCTNSHHPRTIDQDTGCLLASVGEAVLGSPGHQLGSILKDPWMVLIDNFKVISYPNTTAYYFNTSLINFIKNELVKLYVRFLDTQGHIKAYLSNIMDVLRHLTSKLRET